MKKAEPEKKEFRVLGRRLAEELSRDVLKRAQGSATFATSNLGTDTPDART